MATHIFHNDSEPTGSEGGEFHIDALALSGSRPTAQRTSAAIDNGNWLSTSDRATALNTSGDRSSSASISEVKCPSIGALFNGPTESLGTSRVSCHTRSLRSRVNG